MTKLHCSKCGEIKDKVEFNKRSNRKRQREYWCKSCVSINRKKLENVVRHRISQAEWEKNNPEKQHSIQQKSYKKWKVIYRMKALGHYSKGTLKCSECPESRVECLDIDHINNDGFLLRKIQGKGDRLYRWLARFGYPDGFQVLCKNCNWIKYRRYRDETTATNA